MVYIESLENFMQAAQELFVNAPERVSPFCPFRHHTAILFGGAQLERRWDLRWRGLWSRTIKWWVPIPSPVLWPADVAVTRRGVLLRRERGRGYLSRLTGLRRQCLKYKTDQAQDAKKVAKLNAFFLNIMASAKVSSETSSQVLALVEEQGSSFSVLLPRCNAR
eukprot:101326-Rhodomonas_salina.1